MKVEGKEIENENTEIECKMVSVEFFFVFFLLIDGTVTNIVSMFRKRSGPASKMQGVLRPIRPSYSRG